MFPRQIDLEPVSNERLPETTADRTHEARTQQEYEDLQHVTPTTAVTSSPTVISQISTEHSLMCGPCVVPRTHTGFGDRVFQVAGPRLWNSLPASLRQSDTTVGQFKKLLKTHLFSGYCGLLVTVAFTAPCINISSTTMLEGTTSINTSDTG